MRIGLSTTSFPRAEHDVAGAFVLGFARALVGLGHSVEVLAPEPPERVAPPSFAGIDVHWVRYMRPRRWARTFYGAGVPDNLRRDPLAWAGLAPFTAALLRDTLARRGGWDALVSHWALPCGLIAGACREAKPHLSVMHSADLHLLSRLPKRAAIAAHLARTSSDLLFVSEAQREQFVALLDGDAAIRAGARAKTHVQPMGIDADALSAARPAARERDAARRRFGVERFALVTIARLVPIKGLVEAVTELAGRSDLEWLIAGDGPERARLEAAARNARLRVRLLGTVAGEAKRALLHAGDAFVLPSRVLDSGRSEGAPTVLLEAMAHDLPVIASRTGGIGQLVDDARSGLLFDPHAPGELGACIDRIRDRPALARALATEGRRVVERHRWQHIAPRLDRLLRGAGPEGDRTTSSGAAQDAIASR
jgi:glycosyltransferase involved in cell wall biosynthesis